MPHPALHAPRVGYVLLLLPLLLGSASGAPAHGLAAPVEQPAPSASTQFPADSLVSASIPCITGTCEVQIHASTAPSSPLPATTNAAPQGLAQR
jgi:hypothetical protein